MRGITFEPFLLLKKWWVLNTMNITEFTPKLFTMLKDGYGKGDFKSDFLAGLTVAIVALPLSMALAIASGASPDKGMVTAVVAGFLISFLGGSRVQVGGPTGAFVVVVFNVIAHHGFDGLVLATLMAGLILVVAGYTKFGQLVKFIPHPVVTGFTAGIAVIIASSQVKDFFGLKMETVPAEFVHKWQAYFSNFNTADMAALSIGVVSLAIIVLLRKFAPKLPGYLIAVVVSSLAVHFMHLPIDTVGTKFPDIPSGFPDISFPEIDFLKVKEVIPSAFVIAFLAGIEALLSAVVADGMIGSKHRPNQELVAQGLANIASSLFLGLPATGAIARTATNIKAGGKTPVAGILHAVFILLFMLFAMDIVAFVPLAALAAILFVVAWGMSEINKFIHIFKMSKIDRNIMLLTFILTVMVDLTIAIGVGVTLASLLFMHEMSKSVEISSQGNNAKLLLDSSDAEADEEQRAILPKGVEVFRIAGPVFFGVAGELMDTLKSVGMPKILIIRMRMVPYLDASGVMALSDIITACRKKHTKVIFSALGGQPKKILKRGGVNDDQEKVFFAKNYDAAVSLAEKLIGNDTQRSLDLETVAS